MSAETGGILSSPLVGGIVLAVCGLVWLIGALCGWRWMLEGSRNRFGIAWVAETFGRGIARIVAGVVGLVVMVVGIVLIIRLV